MIRPIPTSLTTLLAVAIAGAGLTCLSQPMAAQSFKVYVEQDGAYRVTYEDLAAAGLEAPLASDGLGMTCAGKVVPIWVDDGGDGSFGPGDAIEFVGEHLRGERSYFNTFSRYNVYVLSSDDVWSSDGPTVRMTSGAEATVAGGEVASFRRAQHLEEDLLLLRLPGGGEDDELWYWSKLVFNAPTPASRTIDLSDLDPERPAASLRIGLRGWSSPRGRLGGDLADHRVEVRWNGVTVADEEWDGTEPHVLEVPEIDARSLVRGANELQLVVPRRRPSPEADELIDVVMLNWIEVSYSRDDRFDDQATVTLDGTAATARLRAELGRRLVVFGDGGSRFAGSAAEDGETVFPVPPGESVFVVAAADRFLAPAAVALDRPSRLRDRDRQADYIVIAHRTLLDAIVPLAELHRSRGLTVEVVDLQDVYDEFSHALAHPEAIRSFLRYAYESWRPPAPRFVLLVGDASWDARNARANDWNYADWTYRPGEKDWFVKNASTPYAEGADLNRRGLVPTFSSSTSQGHAASDNYFVAFDDDGLPGMAIGRLPVVEPEEVSRIVDKIVRYVSEPGVGPWRRRALFVTDEIPKSRILSDRLAGQLAVHGLAAEKVYPDRTETVNDAHTQEIVDAFDSGQLLVHFFGHGGRYIWRTGPPDLKKNHDLFTLEHLDQLQPGGRLPLVLSMTCYSAPFDHPSADSIGEKLLRIDQRGAIAVVAASWRNSPSHVWSQVMFEELTRPGTTAGEALMRAKRQLRSRVFVETYNLLGDPALPIALPSAPIELEATTVGGSLHVAGSIGLDDFDGRLLVEAVDTNGDAVATTTVDAGSRFALDLDLGDDPSAVRVVRAYAWSTDPATDAIGGFDLDPDDNQPPSPWSPAAKAGDARP